MTTRWRGCVRRLGNTSISVDDWRQRAHHGPQLRSRPDPPRRHGNVWLQETHHGTGHQGRCRVPARFSGRAKWLPLHPRRRYDGRCDDAQGSEASVPANLHGHFYLPPSRGRSGRRRHAPMDTIAGRERARATSRPSLPAHAVLLDGRGVDGRSYLLDPATRQERCAARGVVRGRHLGRHDGSLRSLLRC